MRTCFAAPAFACLVAALLAAPAEVPGAPPSAASATAKARPVIRAEGRWQFSDDGGKTWTSRPPAVAPGRRVHLDARATFRVPDPSASSHWELTHHLRPSRVTVSFRLNGTELPGVLPGMRYKVIRGIPAGRLRKGANELTAKVLVDNRPRGRRRLADLKPRALPLPPQPPELAGQTLRIQTGPALGAFGEDFFTVCLRTNLPAEVRLTVTEQAWAANRRPSEPRVSATTSSAGLYHRFRADRHPTCTRLRYELRASAPGQTPTTAGAAVELPVFTGKGRANDRMRFIITGDSRTRTDKWGVVAAAILAEKPDFLIFNGDMNGHGSSDWEWDEHYFGPDPARRLLATVPYYPVYGNHEEDAAVMRELFYTPSDDGRAKDWAQEIGPALFVGIDGRPGHGWRDSRWIAGTLAASKAKFIFFVSHYPAYSSGNNGELEPDGQPEDRGYRIARRVILPLLRKHRATAFVVAHEHCYERSDLPGGIAQICAAGAGAPLTSRKPDDQARRQNPYSKIYLKTLNYGLFTIAGDTCTFQAKTPAGKVIDTLSWRARRADGTPPASRDGAKRNMP